MQCVKFSNEKLLFYMSFDMTTNVGTLGKWEGMKKRIYSFSSHCFGKKILVKRELSTTGSLYC